MHRCTVAKAQTQSIAPSNSRQQSRASKRAFAPTSGMGNRTVSRVSSGAVISTSKPTITVGYRGDPFEREAERLAPKLTQGEIVAVREATSDARMQLQQASAPQASSIASATHAPGNSGGPLPSRLREDFGLSLGTDLSSVRVHADHSAAQLNARLHARAVTWGSDIYFAAGHYNPNSAAGRELIAHEVVHTVQQDFGRDPSAMMLQCDSPLTKDQIIAALAKAEEDWRASGKKLTDLQKMEGFREWLGPQLQKDFKTDFDTIKRYVLEYEQDYEKQIAKELAAAKSTVNIAPAVTSALAAIESATAAAKKRVQGAIAAQSGNDTSFLELQARYIDAVRTRYAHSAAAKAATAVSGAGTRADPVVLDYFARMPFTNGTDKQRADLENALQQHLFLSGSIEGEVRHLDAQLISIWFWRDVLFNTKTLDEEEVENKEQAEEATQQIEEKTRETPDGDAQKSIVKLTEEERQLLLEFAQQDDNVTDDPKALLEKFKNLTEMEKKILEANKLLNKRNDATASGAIQLSLGDVQGLTGGGSEAEKDINKQLSQAETVLSMLSSKNKKEASLIDFSLIRDAMRALQTEMVMFRGLLRGAGSRYAEMKTFEADIEESIQQFFIAIQESMVKDLAIDILISLIPVVGGPVAIIRKIEKIVRLIQQIQRVLSIVDSLTHVVDVASKAQAAVGVIESKLKQLDQFSADEDYEELVFQLIDDHNLLDYLVLPDFDNVAEEDIQNEVLKIVRDIPKGLTAFSDMFATYKSMPSDPGNDQLAGLGLSAVIAGVLLSPVVAFLAMTALAKIASGIASFDKSIADRLNPVNRRHRKKHKKLSEKQDASKKKLKKARRSGYDYQAKPIKDLIESDYKPALEAELNNAANSLGGNAWSEGFFKYFVGEEVKALNAGRGKKRVKAKLKKKTKGEADVFEMAPMLALKAPSIDFKKTPWRVELKTKLLNTDVEVRPSAATFHEITYKDFAGAGIAYETKPMSGKYKPRKRREIDRWLRAKNRYEFTYASDPATGLEMHTEVNKYIRMPGGNTLPGFLKIDAGFIKQGTDPNSYKNFLGKQLSGGVLSRVNTDTVSKLLPPEYYAKRLRTQIVIAGKAGAGATQNLVWDDGLLAIGNKNRTPRVVDARKLDEVAHVSYEPLSSTQIDEMVDNMFEKDATGAIKKPEKVSTGFKVQSKDQRKQWKDHIAKKSELRQRPKTIETELGYTVNAKRGSLSAKHLPELKTTDDKGHLVAARFNGPDSLNNLVPMNTVLNQGGGFWNNMENTIAQAYIGNGYKTGDFVNLKMTLNYGTYIRRPDTLDVEWKHHSGARVVRKDSKTGIANP